MKVTNRITVHLDDPRLMPPINVMQGDAYTRELEFSLYSGGAQWNVPEGASVAVAYSGASGKGIYDTLPDGSAACIVQDNVVTSVVAPQALSMPGETKLTVVFTDGNGHQLAAFCVTLKVERNPAVGAGKPEDYINLRQWLSGELSELVGDLFVSIFPAGDGYASDETMADIRAAEEAGRTIYCMMETDAQQWIYLPKVKEQDGARYFSAVFDGVEWLVTFTLDDEGGTVLNVSHREIVGLPEDVLKGSTKEITPVQAMAAIQSGRRIVLTHTDSICGDVTVSWLTHVAAYNSVMSAASVRMGNNSFLIQLWGDLSSGTWTSGVFQQPTMDSIPTKLPSPHPLTINGHSYDGSEAVAVDTREYIVTVTGNSTDGYTADKTYGDVLAAHQAGRTVVCLFSGSHLVNSRLPLFMVTDDILNFAMSPMPGSLFMVSLSSSGCAVIENISTLTIGNQWWDFDGDADFTDTINGMIDQKMLSVKRSGAVGNGTTDDTAAFQAALANFRTVYVPGGTYKLSGTLVIRENCGLILSQDTVLQFTQTTGNCIEMRGSATLRGNHAVISAAYGLTGNVISMDTLLDGTDHASIPPYAKSDPMFKRQRFVYDVNIIKPNDAGFNRSEDGVCNGTAIYMHCDGLASISWMWGVSVSGVRIAGGFSYGIHAINADDPDGYTDNAWNHDMRIEAVIEACEVGVALENCNGAHLNVTVQPCQAVDNTAYAKWGVYLNDCRFVDMLRSRVWDWNADNTLWTEGGEHQHIALVGNCRGLLLDDFLCHDASTDIRSLIYTDTDSNYDTMTILQEPGNKWFKSVDGTPYFNDGTANRRLRLSSEKITAEQAEFIHPADGYYTYTPNFTNLASNCRDGYCLDTAGADMSLAGYAVTDYIPIDGGNSHVYRIGGEGISWSDSYGYCRIAWYDADKKLKGSVMSWDKIGSNIYYPVKVEDDTVAAAFSTNANVAPPNGAADFRVSVMGAAANIAITIDEEQSYTAIWHGEPKRLDESIKVTKDNISGNIGDEWELIAEYTVDAANMAEFALDFNAYRRVMILFNGLAVNGSCKLINAHYGYESSDKKVQIVQTIGVDNSKRYGFIMIDTNTGIVQYTKGLNWASAGADAGFTPDGFSTRAWIDATKVFICTCTSPGGGFCVSDTDTMMGKITFMGVRK